MSADRRGRGVSAFTHAAEIALVLAVAAVALSVGGAPVWALWPLGVFSFASLALASIGAVRQGQSLRITELCWVALAPAALCAIQLVPLPNSVLGVLSPDAAELRSFTLGELGLSANGPISLDPPATWRELAKHLSYAALVIAAAQVARKRGGRARVLVGLGIVGGVVALTALVHLLVGAERLYGVYEFRNRSSPILSPFGNPNHLAAFLSVTATCALASALNEKIRTRAWLLGAVYLLSGVVIVLSVSRGGITFFLFGQLALAFLLWRSGRGHAPAVITRQRGWSERLRSSAWTWILAGLAVIAVTGGYLALDELVSEAEASSDLAALGHSKIELWPMVWEAARHYVAVGMGRGAFESAFTRYQTSSPDSDFTHPENIALQLASEIGLVPTLVLAFAFALALFHAVRHRSLDASDAAAIAALAAAALHDVFDFALELPPTMAASSILLGLLARSERTRDSAISRGRTGLIRLNGWAGAAGACALFLLAGFAILRGGGTLQSAEAALSQKLVERAPAPSVLDSARPLFQEHPADYLLYGLVGSAYSTGPGARPELALAFANRTLFLRPLDADAHRVAARALIQLGRRKQAMLEYRLAFESGGWGVIDEAVGATKTLDEVLRVVPHEPEPLRSAAAILWGQGRRALALDTLRVARTELAGRPDAVLVWTLSVSYTVDSGDLPGALKLAEEATTLAPDRPEASLSRAFVLARLDRREEAIQILREALQKNVGHFELSVALADNLHRVGARGEAREVLQRLEPFVTDDRHRSRLFAFQGDLHRTDGRMLNAIDAYLSAARIDPENASFHEVLSQLYESIGRTSDAMREIRECARLEGRLRPELKARLDRLKNASAQPLQPAQRDLLLEAGEAPASAASSE